MSLQMYSRFKLTRDEFVIQNLFACYHLPHHGRQLLSGGDQTGIYRRLLLLVLISPHLDPAKMEMQNANPTILSVADLPTRKTAASRPKRALAFLPPTYAADPFAATPDLVSDDGTDESDDDEVESIDAQEIYGTLVLLARIMSQPTDPRKQIS